MKKVKFQIRLACDFEMEMPDETADAIDREFGAADGKQLDDLEHFPPLGDENWTQIIDGAYDIEISDFQVLNNKRAANK